MNNDEIAHIRKFLVQRMETIRSRANHTKKKLKNCVDKLADPLDMAVMEANNSIELSCRGKEWEQLLEIQETIMRIDHGLFGICDHCGRDISKKRLKFAPMSKLCIDCQKKLESRHDMMKTKSSTYKGIKYYTHA